MSASTTRPRPRSGDRVEAGHALAEYHCANLDVLQSAEWLADCPVASRVGVVLEHGDDDWCLEVLRWLRHLVAIRLAAQTELAA